MREGKNKTGSENIGDGGRYEQGKDHFVDGVGADHWQNTGEYAVDEQLEGGFSVASRSGLNFYAGLLVGTNLQRGSGNG